MTERMHTPPDVYIDGRPLRGRSLQREDGTHASLDLTEVKPGDKVRIIVGSDYIQEIEKTEGDSQGSALENWRLPAEPERTLGDRAVRLVILEPNPSGTSFLTHSVVLREGYEVGYVGDDTPNSIRSLGVVGTILFSSAEQGSLTPIERVSH